jgi:CheY-like chemotaxis protein
MNTEIARAVLEARGVQVTSVQDGQAACSAFAASAPGTFDAILMDIRMPVMNGRDATRQIRGMERPDALSIPILAMSADAFDDDIQASLACGMNDHIAKPIHPGTLYEKLSRGPALTALSPVPAAGRQAQPDGAGPQSGRRRSFFRRRGKS